MSANLNFEMWSPEYQEDLYQIYQTLRDDSPVHEYQSESNIETKCWILSRYHDVREVIRDKANFKNAETRNDLIRQLQTSDGQKHKNIRLQASPKLIMSTIGRFEPAVNDIVARLLDSVEARGGCELSRELAFEIPRQVVPEVLGFPDHLTEKILGLVDPLAGYDPQSPVFPQSDLGENLVALVDELIAYKLDKPGADIVSELLELERLGELEVGGTVLVARSFSFAAFDTTVNLIANGTVLLADNPLQRKKLIDRPELLPQAIEEMLRLESPTQMIPRRVQQEVELHNQTLAVGDEVLLLLGAANRDERHFQNADAFDIERSQQDHIAFGSGIHICVGRHLAKLEATAYFRELLLRFPEFKIESRRYKASGWSRSFAEVMFKTE